MARLLGRATSTLTQSGERAQLQRYFEFIPEGWPMAALSRQLDCGDAGEHRWLRADPAYVRADVGGARLMAWGNLELSEPEANQLCQAIQPVFAGDGLLLSQTHPQRWYLKIPPQWQLPQFSDPDVALGEDILQHLPQGRDRRWSRLLNECQIVLHNHPVNEQRRSYGRVPINSLWLWGAGQLPAIVNSSAGRIESSSHELNALAAAVAQSHGHAVSESVLVDLREQRDWPALEAGRFAEALAQPRLRGKDRLTLDFSDGCICTISARWRWSVFRRPIGAEFFG